MPEMLPVIADVTVDAERVDGVGEVALDKISGAIERLREALKPTMDAPVTGGLGLESVEVALAVTVGGRSGYLRKESSKARPR